MRKMSLSFDEKVSKVNFTKRTWAYLLLPILIIIAGLVVTLCCNFNLGIDFTGGSTITIYTNSAKDTTYSEIGYDISINSEYSSAKAVIAEVLSEYDVNVVSYQKVGMTIEDYAIVPSTGVTNAIIVKYQNNTDDVDAQNTEIRTAMLSAFGYTSEFDGEFVISGSLNPVTTQNYLFKISLALLITILVLFFYTWIRFNLTGAFAVMLSAILDVLTTTALVSIFRIQIGTVFVPVLFGIAILSAINAFVVINKMREPLKRALLDGKVDNSKIVNSALSTNVLRTIFSSVLLVVALIIVMAFGGITVASVLAPVLIGIIVIMYNSTFIAPSMWAMAYRPTKRKIARVREKEEKKDKKEEYQV